MNKIKKIIKSKYNGCLMFKIYNIPFKVNNNLLHRKAKKNNMGVLYLIEIRQYVVDCFEFFTFCFIN